MARARVRAKRKDPFEKVAARARKASAPPRRARPVYEEALPARRRNAPKGTAAQRAAYAAMRAGLAAATKPRKAASKAKPRKAAKPTRKAATKPHKSQQWIFEWKGGGYNTVSAATRTAALKKATALGASRKLPWGKRTVKLVVNTKTLHVAKPGEARAWDRAYAGMFN
ncbi:MAG: hypothetical protein Q8S13_02690 [Dehalococcoidia bacterium]|nr:hypothetical protein [Dehalococcoidia bacterium]